MGMVGTKERKHRTGSTVSTIYAGDTEFIESGDMLTFLDPVTIVFEKMQDGEHKGEFILHIALNTFNDRHNAAVSALASKST